MLIIQIIRLRPVLIRIKTPTLISRPRNPMSQQIIETSMKITADPITPIEILTNLIQPRRLTKI